MGNCTSVSKDEQEANERSTAIDQRLRQDKERERTEVYIHTCACIHACL